MPCAREGLTCSDVPPGYWIEVHCGDIYKVCKWNEGKRQEICTEFTWDGAIRTCVRRAIKEMATSLDAMRKEIAALRDTIRDLTTMEVRDAKDDA